MPRTMRFHTQQGVNGRHLRDAPIIVDHITVDHATLTQVHGGSTSTLLFTAIDDHSNTLTRTISVVSADPTKATVSPASGPSPLTVTVTPVAAGSSVITASSEGKTVTSTTTVS